MAATMSGERLEVNVTFDSARGYIASAPEVRQPIIALSLGGLRRRIDTLMLPDDSIIILPTSAGSSPTKPRSGAR
jgi:hypothetical protein